MTRAVGLPLLSVKTSNALFVHNFPWSEWIGGNKGSLAHPTRMPHAARRDRYGMSSKKTPSDLRGMQAAIRKKNFVLDRLVRKKKECIVGFGLFVSEIS